MSLEKLEITHEKLFSNGESFGEVGTYQEITGIAHFSIDPNNPNNNGIIDINLAPRNPHGEISFTSQFVMLKPTRQELGNGSVLFDVVNRGRKTAMNVFNSSNRTNLGDVPIDSGNGFLMRQGYTVVFGGWQYDVPPEPGLIGISAPQAFYDDGSPVQGKIHCWFQIQQEDPTSILLLSDRNHLPHSPTDPNEESAMLFERQHPNELPTAIDRSLWRFIRVEDNQLEPDTNYIYYDEQFKPGTIYELVFTTKKSHIAGLGFAAMRDMVSFLKYAEEGNPCGTSIKKAHAFGASQSGRFLRTYLYTGINSDESGRQALDGVIAHVAGGMKGEFNIRFAQPSKDICYVLPGLFPCADTEQLDPLTGLSGSLLDVSRKNGNLPKIMFTNTSAEYWRGDAALIHTNLSEMSDQPEDSENIRRYLFAGTQHGIGEFPPEKYRSADTVIGQESFNTVDYSPLLRSVLENLNDWVFGENNPPESQHPSLSKGTAVDSEKIATRFQDIPKVNAPTMIPRAMRLDHGDELDEGRTTTLPPKQGEYFPALVSDIGEDYNEISGIILPDISVPLATYTGWNLRDPKIGNPKLVIGITGGLAGSTITFPATRKEQIARSDPRKSIEELYNSENTYIAMVKGAADQLVDLRYLLEEDVERIVEQSKIKWNYYTTEQ